MPTNHYFQTASVPLMNEQRMLEDILVESINIMGMDCWYIIRESEDEIDLILGEDPIARYRRAYQLAMYLVKVEGYEGDRDFLSKFGYEMRDETNMIVARRTFEQYVPASLAPRPREGDLVWVPLLNKLFEITFTEEDEEFFTIGKRSPYLYGLKLQAYKYAQEKIDTGVEEIDRVVLDSAFSPEFELASGNGNHYALNEIVYQGATVGAAATAKVKAWDRNTLKLQVYDVKGVFGANTVIGQSSNAQYTLTTYNPYDDTSEHEDKTNKEFQSESNTVLDWTESNPFGEA